MEAGGSALDAFLEATKSFKHECTYEVGLWDGGGFLLLLNVQEVCSDCQQADLWASRLKGAQQARLGTVVAD